MNKSDLVSRLTARLDGDRRTATAAVNGVLEEIEQSLARGERVSLTGFGTFDRRERGPRTGRNPATGEAIRIGASVAPVFRAGAGLRQVLSRAAGTAAGTEPAVQTSVQTAVAVPASTATTVATATTTTPPKAAKAAKAPKPAKAGTAKAGKAAKAAVTSARAGTAKAGTAKAGKKTSAKGGKKK